MNIFQSVVLGIVEGVTEFLPISSTFHLIFASKLLHLPQNDFQTFYEVFIQAGAILAVIVVYFNYLLSHTKYIKSLLISFIPTAIIGFLLHKVIKTYFFHADMLMIGAFILIGVVFMVVEWLVKQNKVHLHFSIGNISVQHAFLIGLGQSMAVLPGVSRAGAVIITMMLLGFKRDEAALYSFLLAVPTILAASAFDLLKTDFSVVKTGDNMILLLVGFVTAFLSALVVIKLFIKFLQKNTLTSFGLYRVVAGIILFFVK